MTNTNIMDITPILEMVISLISIVITSFVIPWLRAKTTQEQFWVLQDIARIAVNAAEVLYKGSGKGEQKLSYATTYIKEFCLAHNITFDDKSIRQAIENAWKNMTEADNYKIEV